jgi:hypothetical protein
MLFTQPNLDQLSTNDRIIETNKPEALESQFARNSTTTKPQLGKFDFIAYRNSNNQAPEIAKQNNLEQTVDTKLVVEKSKPTIAKPSKFAKLMSYIRDFKSELMPVEQSLYTPLKMEESKVFTNGIVFQFSQNAILEEKKAALSQRIETYNKGFEGAANIDVNFVGIVEGNKAVIYFYSRYHQTRNGVTHYQDQPIVVDLITRQKIQDLTNQIEAGI